MAYNFHRILIVRTDRIGDVILTLPMARVLKNQFPDAAITMLIQPYTADLVENDKNVDHVLFYKKDNNVISIFDLVRTIREYKFDVVFHAHPRFRIALLTWIAGIPIRVGTGYRWFSLLFNNKLYEHRKDARFHELEYNLHLLKTIGCSFNHIDTHPIIEVAAETLEKVRNVLIEYGIHSNNKLVILHPGSGGSARDWSPKNFGIIGKLLSELPNIKIIVTGSRSEYRIVGEVVSKIGDAAVPFVDRVSLKEYSALAKLASLFIANSTGPIHIAAAVGTPVIGFYSHINAISDTRWGPYTEKKFIFVPEDKPQNCKKCLRKKSVSCECMDSISVEKVFQAAINYLRDK
ncbi:MAG: glycosyltransferase family 9 protein [Bacteroidota bacterium]|nr:glycosyltransferase family 9 protein [Bacteroidota bacterium]